MATWNYRIIDFGTHKALHEVHYDEFGAPRAYTADPATFVCDPEEHASDIIAALDMARADCNRAYLTPGDFPAGTDGASGQEPRRD